MSDKTKKSTAKQNRGSGSVKSSKGSEPENVSNAQMEVVDDEDDKKKQGKIGTAFEKLTRNQDYMFHVQQFVEVKGDSVSIRSRDCLANIRSLVACIGPPGAGKSTLCNALLTAGYGTKFTFFEPSSSIASYTKGLWVLAQSVRMQLPQMRWEVMDMEGFQPDLYSSWGMTMVLSLLAEVVIFCNRDARYDALFKAAEVFQKGRDLSSQFGMRPVTKQIFVQLEEGMDEEDKAACVKKIKETIPNVDIEAFEIPHIRNKNKKDHEFVTFHEDMKEAVTDLTKKFNFPATSDAVASRAKHIESLLDAFNESDFKKCSDISQEFLQADCERIYKATIAIYRNECYNRAMKTKLPNMETTLEEFMGKVDPIVFDFTVSVFFLEGSSEEFCEKFLERMPKVEPIDFYKPVYDDKVQDLAVLKERAAKCTSDAELAYLNETNEFIEGRKVELLQHVATLKYGQKIKGDGSKFLNSKKHEQRGMFLGMDAENRSAFVPDFTSFFLFVRQQNELLENMWNAQTVKAQWKSPCAAHGKMECQSGHKVKMNPSITCDKQIRDKETGKTGACGGVWYWVDGPEQYAMCNGPCETVKYMEPGLKCVKCGADLLCSIRTTDYYP